VNRLFLRDLLTGVVALASLAGLILTLIFFGELMPLAERNYEFQMRVANAGGLDETSPVTLNGVKVGQVIESKAMIGASAGETAGAMLKVRIKRSIDIPRASKISLDRGFVGGSTLEFVTIDLTSEQLRDVVKDGEVMDGGAPETLLGSIKQIVEGPLAQFSSTAAKIDALAVEYTTLGKRLNELVEPRTLADVQGGKDPNLRSTLARIDVAVTSANMWLADDQLRTQFREVVNKADSVLAEAKTLAQAWTTTAQTTNETVESVGKEVRGASEKLNELAASANGSLDKVRAAGEELAKTLEAVNSGKGTLGQLVNNPDLYRNLDDAAKRLDKALDEAQQMLEKYKNEGIKIKL
jgi:phospholipid/cholesterol/gamma-HCH transport system substrate-binding protein